MVERSVLDKAFAERRWRVTVGVRKIFDLLVSSEVFYSAHEMAKLLGNEFDVTTIYRVLEKLEAVRLVHQFEGKWKLCTNPSNIEEAHHFLICQECGRAEEIFLDYQASIADQLDKEKNFLLKEVHLGFFGICSRCRSK